MSTLLDILNLKLEAGGCVFAELRKTSCDTISESAIVAEGCGNKFPEYTNPQLLRTPKTAPRNVFHKSASPQGVLVENHLKGDSHQISEKVNLRYVSKESTADTDKSAKRSGELVKTFVDMARMAGVDNGILLDEVVVLGELDAPAELLQCSPQELQAWGTAVGLRLVRQRGLVPNDWTKVSHCKHCGPVWSFHNLDTLSCGWCEMRLAGKPFPKPC